jgi:DNA polymerase-3 subunit alpha
MKTLFSDVPEAISNTKEIVDKVEVFELNSKPIMPEFKIPAEFADADDYLRHITYEGAKIRYSEIGEELKNRIDFELETIKKMGFPGYFLIVWDFLVAARNMGVWVGPGRGSAAGSVVSYALRITDIDPLKYDLLFERFLNPDRISMPDIDIDFDDDGRNKLLKWVSDKYGKMRVAHLITFGTMAAKMAIRDVARVQKLPLSEADRLAKLVPEKPGITLAKALKDAPDFKNELENGKPEVSSVIKNAMVLEGSIRNTGTHACGIIIGREDLDNYVPLTSVKESELDIATQFDGKFIESIGLLKMDFLGLKTLSIIKDTIQNIRRSKGIELDIETIPFDDKETYELFGRGDTVALFQFESDGMRKYLKDLKPSRFEDLIAMVSLYRPGPMNYIPSFIRRKHGQEEIEYDLPIMEEILKETYGITVYQEQVMLLSRKLAGFTRGQSDSLRKAMGKKKIAEMAKLYVKFVEGCLANGFPKDKVEKIWKDWEEFANYAFNKSHATCYAHLAYQTGYLKTHFPAEFMAANLSRNLNDIKKITQLIGEANHMNIEVTRPDVNESALDFTVTREGVIRFGMAAIKGVGGAAVEQLIAEREKNGFFKSIFDFAKRVNLRSVNKRSFEALAMAGAFDGFPDSHRAQYFYKETENDPEFIEIVIKHGARFQEKNNSTQVSLFGEMEDAFEILDPPMPETEPWSLIKKLKLEKQVTGFYISGHPLDEFRFTMERYCNIEISELKDNLSSYDKQTVMFAGMITDSQQRTSKNGSPFGIFSIEDFSGNMSFMLFNEDYLKRKHMLEVGNKVFVVATVEERRHQPGNFDIRVGDIFLLTEAMSKLAKSIVLNISALDISDELIEKLTFLAKENEGSCAIELKIDDPEDGKVLRMKSSKIKVEPRSFVHEIDKLENLKFSIN